MNELNEDNKNNQEIITVIVDGEERPYVEGALIRDWQMSSEEAAATMSEEEDDEFQWVLPMNDEDEIPEFHHVNVVKPIKRDKFPNLWNKQLQPGFSGMLIAICLAVPVGLMLGLLILKMFIHTEPITTSADSEIPTVATEKEKQPTSGDVTALLPAMTVPVVQAGVYSSEESANNRVEELSGQGYGSIIHKLSEQYFVYMSVAGNINQAKLWESELKAKGIEEVWAKEIAIPERQVQLASQTEGENLVAEAKSFSLLAGEIIDALLLGNTNADVVTSISTILNGENKDYENETAKELHNLLENAHKGLLSFQTSSENTDELTQSQSSLLKYISVYIGESN
ncbi:SPOR domain-containing protein [Pseudogracilibacillus auburnensis]|uniref:SPOR domain-containing protein n=1 Tax=Pseudogracilibacillus auburnensis TaxID=1494959 RepID=UPI001A970493|nr:SPOR domain-containing protein [Pseudogracilibacillus auburnensis]MBO1005601.1 SPOR domain-containing protein [Pseudogracilibacillus auburnensis]